MMRRVRAKPIPPPSGLGRDAGLEEARPHFGGHPGPVVAHDHAAQARLRFHPDLDVPAPPAQRIDRVLDQGLERPLEQHGVAQRRRAGSRRLEREHHGARERRQAWPEVAHDPLGHGTESHRLPPRGPADAPLEPLGHPLETFGIGFEVVGHLARGRRGVLAE